ncbi:MAG TPA: DPP IV N-terminal domain-containing protein [Egibacteraceae bacterium]|nr:DPP IV N-terminal domain-containing protein [Egibacteraceae bacterium]
MTGGGEGFPRRYARTRGFTLGVPRCFSAAPDGARVAFLRSPAGDDPRQRLWVLDLASGVERCVAEPHRPGAPDGLPAEERARRERVREAAGGIVAYATDRAVVRAAFALGGRLYVADLTGGARALAVDGPVVDPRPSPDGRQVAYVRERALYVADLDGGGARRLVGEDAPTVSWGLAEFVAAEELGRTRGFWWAPDSRRLAVARVDTADVARWHLSDPADPARPPTPVAYPAAGTANARVGLDVVALDGSRVPVTWDVAELPYLVDVVWGEEGPLTVVVQSRDQRTVQVLAADPDTGAPSRATRRVSRSSAVCTSRPSASQRGTPGTMSTQRESRSRRTTLAAPVSGSAARTCTVRWARDCTTTVRGPSSPQTTSTR